MSGRYDGINTLAGIAQAGFSRKTAKALEEANKIALERNRIMRTDSIRAKEDSRLMRLDREEAKKEKMAAEAETRKQAEILKDKEEYESRKRRDQRINAARLEEKVKEHRLNEIRKSQNKTLLYTIHDDMKESLADSSLSALDKYIKICGMVTLLKKEKIDKKISDSLPEIEQIKKMIDDINNNLKVTRDSFTKQDEDDHDQLIKILETDEEWKIHMLGREISELEKSDSSHEEIKKLYKELDEEDEITYKKNQEMKVNKKSIESLQRKSVALSDDSYITQLTFDLFTIKTDNFLKDLINYSKTGTITSLLEVVAFGKIKD